ncbi:MAG: family 43 glycosylhydrolase, partial [Planctomycetota bacterium]
MVDPRSLWAVTAVCLLPAALLSLAVAVSASAYGEERVGTYANPLDVLLADPFVLLDKGTYYLYATSSGSGYRVWSSPALVNWRLRGHAFRRSERS